MEKELNSIKISILLETFKVSIRSSEEHVGRGRPGRSRYKNKRTTVIPYREFVLFVGRFNQNILKSLVALLYYAPLRISEVVGDGTRKWKVLSAYGRGLSYQGTLPKDWQNSDQKNGLWDWRHRDSLPGILKEDISIDGLLLKIQSKPLKHGRRDGPLEIDIRYPFSEVPEVEDRGDAGPGGLWPSGS